MRAALVLAKATWLGQCRAPNCFIKKKEGGGKGSVIQNELFKNDFQVLLYRR